MPHSVLSLTMDENHAMENTDPNTTTERIVWKEKQLNIVSSILQGYRDGCIYQLDGSASKWDVLEKSMCIITTLQKTMSEQLAVKCSDRAIAIQSMNVSSATLTAFMNPIPGLNCPVKRSTGITDISSRLSDRSFCSEFEGYFYWCCDAEAQDLFSKNPREYIHFAETATTPFPEEAIRFSIEKKGGRQRFALQGLYLSRAVLAERIIRPAFKDPRTSSHRIRKKYINLHVKVNEKVFS